MKVVSSPEYVGRGYPPHSDFPWMVRVGALPNNHALREFMARNINSRWVKIKKVGGSTLLYFRVEEDAFLFYLKWA